MNTVMISLDTIDKVKSFVNDIVKFDCDFDLKSSRYIVDAKSIMGIFSLDLSQPIELCINGAEDDEIEDILEVLDKYVIK
ncbi:MAG: HPr family phosphocarrier protein [Lachnospiraceae bacterium]|nr:HPr family phosphocarrier protein [Lachnospiraceae bacterium]